MKFDPRRASKKPPKNRDPNKPWDLRTYRVRKSQFQNVDLRGKEVSKKVLEIFGDEMIKAIKEEAKRASGMGTGIPRTKEFLDSFYYEISKGGAIKIKSEWQWVKKYLERKDSYEMTWLTRKSNAEKKVIPVKTKSGEVVFRTLPLRTENKWIHPAVYKFNFIEQGIEKGRIKAIRRATFFLTKKISGDE